MRAERSPIPITETEAAPPKPFPIRGHHLNLYSLINRGEDPALLARRMKVDYQWELLDVDPEKVTRAQDTIGTTSAAAARYQQGVRSKLEQFRQLPDDYPIEIHAQPDAICDTCILGRHCDTSGIVIGDEIYTGFFIEFAKREGLESKITVTSEITWVEKMTLGLNTKRVSTDAETVRKMLTGGNFERIGSEKI